MTFSSEQNNIFEEQANTLHQQLKQVQEENRRLQQQLIQKNKNETSNESDNQQKSIEFVSNLLIRFLTHFLINNLPKLKGYFKKEIHRNSRREQKTQKRN